MSESARLAARIVEAAAEREPLLALIERYGDLREREAVEQALSAAAERIAALPAVVTQHSCWDDHDGPDGGHADGSPCRDRVLWEAVKRADVLAALRDEP